MKPVLILTILASILVACSSNPPSITGTPSSSNIVPPPATLEINGASQISAIGSYCWRNETIGLCSDVIGMPSPQSALIATSPIAANLQLPLAESPTSLNFTVHAVSEEDELEVEAVQYRWWQPRNETQSELPLQSQQTLNLDLEPGLYVLGVHAHWDKLGSVMYGFLIEVQ